MKFMTRRVGNGLKPWASFKLEAQPKRTELHRTELDLLSSAQALRTLRLYLFAYPDSLIHFVRSASLLTRHVTSLSS